MKRLANSPLVFSTAVSLESLATKNVPKSGLVFVTLFHYASINSLEQLFVLDTSVSCLVKRLRLNEIE